MIDLKVGVIIPDRGDRPKFLENCLRMLARQTVKPFIVEVMNEPPKSDKCDITYRYRTGYDKLRGEGLDCIFFIENDDYYADNYMEAMLKKWLELNKPQLLGPNYTMYYHIKLRAYSRFDHHHRASAMNTLITPDMDFKWCHDEEAYTDQWLWRRAKMAAGKGARLVGRTFTPEEMICIGIKHGEGLTGGAFHTTRLDRYSSYRDPEMNWLRKNMNDEGFEFYSKYYKE